MKLEGRTLIDSGESCYVNSEMLLEESYRLDKMLFSIPQIRPEGEANISLKIFQRKILIPGKVKSG